MPATPFAISILLSVFVDPSDKRRALASISESPIGASSWQEILLPGLQPPLNWPYSKLLYELSKDDTSREDAIQLGKNLYAVFFPDAIQNAFTRARAKSADQGIRLVIDCSEELIDVPWELLHDGKDFLLLQDCSIIRVVRSLPPGIAYFGPVTQMGLITVTPDFDATPHIKELQATLEGIGVKTNLCQNPNRGQLLKFLEDIAIAWATDDA